MIGVEVGEDHSQISWECKSLAGFVLIGAKHHGVVIGEVKTARLDVGIEEFEQTLLDKPPRPRAPDVIDIGGGATCHHDEDVLLVDSRRYIYCDVGVLLREVVEKIRSLIQPCLIVEAYENLVGSRRRRAEPKERDGHQQPNRTVGPAHGGTSLGS